MTTPIHRPKTRLGPTLGCDLAHSVLAPPHAPTGLTPVPPYVSLPVSAAMYPTAAITPIAHSVPQPPPLLQQQQREGEGAATSPGRQPRPLTAPLHLQDRLASGNCSA